MRGTALLVTLLFASLVSCGQEDEQPLPAKPLRIASGLEGGVYRIYALEHDSLLALLRAAARAARAPVAEARRVDA